MFYNIYHNHNLIGPGNMTSYMHIYVYTYFNYSSLQNYNQENRMSSVTASKSAMVAPIPLNKMVKWRTADSLVNAAAMLFFFFPNLRAKKC